MFLPLLCSFVFVGRCCYLVADGMPTLGVDGRCHSQSGRWISHREKLELKMVEIKNHRRFTLRCLSKGLVPVSIKLKTTLKTTKGMYIVRKAERMLMNERIRSINNIITIHNRQIYTCMNIVKGMINREVIEECHEFINHIRERRHFKTMERQKKKFERLWQKNTGGCPNILNGGDAYNQENGTKVNSSKEPETTTSGQQQQQQSTTRK